MWPCQSQVLAQFEAVQSTLVLDPAPDIRELMAMALALEQAKGAWEVCACVHTSHAHATTRNLK